MNPPRRRIWLYQPDTDPEVVEIVLLGLMDDIAPPCAMLKSAAERWRGFRHVHMMGGAVCGIIRAELTNVARYEDPIAEALAMIQDLGATSMMWAGSIEWAAGAIYESRRAGLVGTW